jgi:hypothetical protein
MTTVTTVSARKLLLPARARTRTRGCSCSAPSVVHAEQIVCLLLMRVFWNESIWLSKIIIVNEAIVFLVL